MTEVFVPVLGALALLAAGSSVTMAQTTYTAGPGLNLSGNQFSANFGATAGTVAQGNDSRIVDALQTTGGTVSGNLGVTNGHATVLNSGTTPLFLTGPGNPHPAPGVYTASTNMFATCLWQEGTICGSSSDTLANAAYVQQLIEWQSQYPLQSEWGLTIDANVNTGRALNWQASAAYSAGTLITANGNVYQATTGGTSASSGSGPSGTGTSISDGSVTWTYKIPYGNNGKLPFNSLVTVGANGGNTWAGDFNLVLLPGARGQLFRGVEFDFTNQSGVDCGYANSTSYTGGDCYNVWLQTGGANEIQAQLEIAAENSFTGGQYGETYGIWIDTAYGSNKNARLADILDTSSAAIGLQFGHDPNYGTYASHSTATILDQSTSPYGLWLDGVYSAAAVNLSNANLASHLAIQMTGNQKVCWNTVYACVYSDGANMYVTNASGGTMAEFTPNGMIGGLFASVHFNENNPTGTWARVYGVSNVQLIATGEFKITFTQSYPPAKRIYHVAPTSGYTLGRWQILAEDSSSVTIGTWDSTNTMVSMDQIMFDCEVMP